MKKIVNVIIPREVTIDARKKHFDKLKEVLHNFNIKDNIGECPYDHFEFPIYIKIDFKYMVANRDKNIRTVKVLDGSNEGIFEVSLYRYSNLVEYLKNCSIVKLNMLINNE